MAIEDIIRTCTNVAELDRGGQKVVYSAEHPHHGHVVLKRGQYPHPNALERISREVGLLAAIDSEFYPKHLGFVVEAPSRSFLIIEERIDGQPLALCMDRFSTEPAIIPLLRLLVDALGIIWDRNVVHRDIKPGNIIIRPNGRPVIIDLGIARLLDLSSLTLPAPAAGPCTPPYASPEQLRNDKPIIDVRADFFALGIISLQLHLGFHPFEPAHVGDGHSIPDNILAGRYTHPETKQGTTPEFSELLRRLLQPEPHQRFRNRGALASFISDRWGASQ
jgi:serine/threonine-protein kinase